ncbi:MAG: hypothetical protein LAO56_18895 [Acidobacteriia bacterium]|nr:hypothetical protein [Terriglobia bacterium]
MKTLGLCSVLLFALASIAPAQVSSEDASRAPILNPDKDEFQQWLAHASTPGRTIDDVRASTWSAEGDSFCAFMRTYRVKREHRGSDVAHLAGYTKCVPTKRFEMKSAVLQSTP